MKNKPIKNKANNPRKFASIIALMLLVTVTATLVAVPIANAHDPKWTIISYAYLVASPNPVGVGQSVALVFWIDTPLPGAMVNNDIRRHDYKLTITAPDESTEVLTWDVVQDTTSVQYTSWTPDQVGEYTILFEYSEQEYTWTEPLFSWAGPMPNVWTGDIFAAANTTIALTVQEESLTLTQTSSSFPTEYWARPIEGQNTEWFKVSSNWLGSPYIQGAGAQYGIPGSFQPDGIAPNAPHIMWTKPIADGGIVGGTIGINGTTYFMGNAYQERFINPLIMQGRLYYELPNGNSGGGGGWICVDLLTGEELWYNNEMGVSGTGVPEPEFGYLYRFDDGNQHGVLPNGVLFTEDFSRSIDSTTGEFTKMNWTNVPTVYAGTGDDNPIGYIGPNGEILKLVIDSENKWMAQWNSAKMTDGEAYGPDNWYTGETDGSTSDRFDWNVSIPDLGSGSWSIVGPNLGNNWCINLDDIVLLIQGNLGTHVGSLDAIISQEGANITAVSLNPNSRGDILWTKHYSVAPGNVTRNIVGWDPENGVFITHDKETMVFDGFSLVDGSHIWGPTERTNDYSYFRETTVIAYGNIYYTGGYGGTLYCYDVKDGNLKWTYGNGGEGNSTNSGLKTAWGSYPIFVDVIADGKVYLGTTEHSPDSPYYKDVKYRCVNATTGEEIWTLMGWATGMDAAHDVVADGFFVFLNCYDMQVYCVGKGPSATTVSIQNDVITHGSEVLVTGTVMDIAAGTTQNEQAARFPLGVPAVSDESMSDWMEYVYMQKPRPSDTVGVQVHITAIDPNNNYQDYGIATSDAYGNYAFAFEPQVPGLHKIVAAFEGTESYWPSASSTYVTVVEESTPSIPIEPELPEKPTEPEQSTETSLTTDIVIIAAVAVAAFICVTVYFLLKRK